MRPGIKLRLMVAFIGFAIVPLLAAGILMEAATDQFEFTCTERLDLALEHVAHQEFDVVLLDLTLPLAQPSAFDEDLSARLHDLCDAHLTLSAGRVGARDLLMLKIDKVNNKEPITDNLISFEVASGAGMRIIPLSQVKT